MLNGLLIRGIWNIQGISSLQLVFKNEWNRTWKVENGTHLWARNCHFSSSSISLAFMLDPQLQLRDVGKGISWILSRHRLDIDPGGLGLIRCLFSWAFLSPCVSWWVCSPCVFCREVWMWQVHLLPAGRQQGVRQGLWVWRSSLWRFGRRGLWRWATLTPLCLQPALSAFLILPLL